jgi:hypothetical protein
VHRIGIEQRADLTQGSDNLAVPAAIDERAASGRGIEAQDHAHGGGLAGPVRPEETGDPSGLHRKAEVVQRGERSEALGELVDLDHDWGVLVVHRRRRSALVGWDLLRATIVCGMAQRTSPMLR